MNMNKAVTSAACAKKTAVLFIEFQNDFVHKEGILYGAVQACIEKNDVVGNTVALMKRCRELGVTIIHAPITYCSTYEKAANQYGILYNVKTSNSFKDGAFGAAFYKPTTPIDGDIIVTGKHGLDTFHGTDLDAILRSRGIINLGICGFLTNCCVDSTMRTGYEKGYNTYCLSDVSAATSIEQHDHAVGFSWPMFSQVMTAKEFTDKIAAAEPKLIEASFIMNTREQLDFKKIASYITQVLTQRIMCLGTLFMCTLNVLAFGQSYNHVPPLLWPVFLAVEVLLTFVIVVVYFYAEDRSTPQKTSDWVKSMEAIFGFLLTTTVQKGVDDADDKEVVVMAQSVDKAVNYHFALTVIFLNTMKCVLFALNFDDVVMMFNIYMAGIELLIFVYMLLSQMLTGPAGKTYVLADDVNATLPVPSSVEKSDYGPQTA